MARYGGLVLPAFGLLTLATHVARSQPPSPTPFASSPTFDWSRGYVSAEGLPAISPDGRHIFALDEHLEFGRSCGDATSMVLGLSRIDIRTGRRQTRALLTTGQLDSARATDGESLMPRLRRVERAVHGARSLQSSARWVRAMSPSAMDVRPRSVGIDLEGTRYRIRRRRAPCLRAQHLEELVAYPVPGTTSVLFRVSEVGTWTCCGAEHTQDGFALHSLVSPQGAAPAPTPSGM